MLASAVTSKQTRSRFVVASYGFDPALCCIGGDPYGSLISEGLRVPTLASTSVRGTVTTPNTGTAGRYLFQLCTLRLPAKCPIWLVGLAQLLTMWQETNVAAPPTAPVEKLVGLDGTGNPNWHFTDANVSWHLRFVRDPPHTPTAGQSVLTCDSFAYQWSDAPALVFQNAAFPAANLSARGNPDNYTALTGYVPPYGGLPRGVDVGGLGSFFGIRHPWSNQAAQAIDPIALEGPGALVFYASVWQTNPATRQAVTTPGAFPATTDQGEVGWVLDWPTSIYGRIGGKFFVERRAGVQGSGF